MRRSYYFTYLETKYYPHHMAASRNPTPAESFARLFQTFGERAAAARRRSGLTLAELAERSGLSAAYLSQIESAAANPTVRALAQLAAGLDTDVAALFGTADGGHAQTFAPYYSPAARATTVDGMAGVWELTASGSSKLVARLVHGGPGDHAAPTAHAGEEFVVVLRGRCALHVDGSTVSLMPGDACHYDASVPHHLSATSPDLTVSVVMSENH